MNDPGIADKFDARTSLWLSREEMEKISTASLCIIGCGGTGSLVATFAPRLGFTDLIIVDGDVLEESNLNRFISAGPDDIGQPKVGIVSSDLARRVPHCAVEAITENFPNERVIRLLRDRPTFVIGCMDSVKPRVELDLACRRFARTYLDIGTGFARDDENDLKGSGGQVLVSTTGSACVMCLGFPHLVDSRDYVAPGVAEPAPSVLTLNAIVVALALELALRIVSGSQLEFNKLSYDRSGLITHTASVSSDPDCRVCGNGTGRRVQAILGQV